MEFEKHFNVTIDDSDAEKIQTVGDAVSYLKAKTENANA
jgi:acyl carrier protein